MGKFTFILKDKSIVTYTKWEDIPSNLDFLHVTCFLPDFVEGPHTEEEHEENKIWNTRLQQLMEKERASSNKKK